MAENTKIEWAHHTFNPWIGCTKVSPACDHCYAEADFATRRKVVQWGAGQPRKHTAPSTWAMPLRWNAEAERLGVRYRVFCASLADVFDNEVPAEWRAELFNLILSTPHLDWLLLTKRIGNAARMINETLPDNMKAFPAEHPLAWPWPNVWIGASITSQAEADRDIPKLLAVPAAKRFLSMEPLLGPVYIEDIQDPAGGVCLKPLAGLRWIGNGQGRCEARSLGARIDWVIVGGESGPHARPMHPDWASSLLKQCQAAGVPFMFKQWGEWAGHQIANDGEIEPPMQMDLRRIARWEGDSAREVMPHEPAGSVLAEGFVSSWVGKKAAGRLLDGRTWDEVPA